MAVGTGVGENEQAGQGGRECKRWNFLAKATLRVETAVLIIQVLMPTSS